MMDDSRGGFLGLGGLGSGGGSGLSKLSPYLNVDPSYLQTETPEYILNQVSAQTSDHRVHGTETQQLRLFVPTGVLTVIS